MAAEVLSRVCCASPHLKALHRSLSRAGATRTSNFILSKNLTFSYEAITEFNSNDRSLSLLGFMHPKSLLFLSNRSFRPNVFILHFVINLLYLNRKFVPSGCSKLPGTSNRSGINCETVSIIGSDGKTDW